MYVSPCLSRLPIALPNHRFIGEIFRIVSIMWHECSTAPPAPVPVCTAPVLTTAAAAHRVRSRCLQTLIKLDELIILSIFHARRRTRIRADVCEAPTMLEVKIYAPLCAIGKTFLSLDLFQRLVCVLPCSEWTKGTVSRFVKGFVRLNGLCCWLNGYDGLQTRSRRNNRSRGRQQKRNRGQQCCVYEHHAHFAPLSRKQHLP